MKRKCLAEEQCPLMRGYDAIGDWWSLLIVARMILVGAHRFSQLQDELGMARNILAARLTKLVEAGIVEKAPASDGSAYLEYRPTDKGRDLMTVVVALQQWGERHFPPRACAQPALVDRVSRRRVLPLEVHAADGRVLRADEITLGEPAASGPSGGRKGAGEKSGRPGAKAAVPERAKSSSLRSRKR